MSDDMALLLCVGILGGILMGYLWMQDKLPEDLILKPFLSENGKLILAALEKQASSPKGLRERNQKYESVVDSFFDPYVWHAGYIDRNVLKHTRRRLERDANKREAIAGALESAGQVLMGGEDNK